MQLFPFPQLVLWYLPFNLSNGRCPGLGRLSREGDRLGLRWTGTGQECGGTVRLRRRHPLDCFLAYLPTAFSLHLSAKKKNIYQVFENDF